MRFLKTYTFVFLLMFSFSNQSVGEQPVIKKYYIAYAKKYLGYHERTHREEIYELVGVDPVEIEWCAAFVNAILHKAGLAGSEIVSDYPLLARSFLKWGHTVDSPRYGDIMVFERGESWQGHVGFYVGTTIVNGVEFYEILGGNQKNEINISLYPAHRLIEIKRATI